MSEPAAAPRRLLVVSATIGEGHNATASALEERARRLWPDCEIRRVDTLDVMGRGTGPVFRWIYRANVETTPWLYDFFYRQLVRRPWFATAACDATGVWAGLTLDRVVRDFRPDLVVSTYPIGTGGLNWLRRRGRLDVPLTAIISDFAPHPFWVYPEVDQHYVASEVSLRVLATAQPDARGVVGAPPVLSAFHPGDPSAARTELGLPTDVPVVLISCGSLGFGSVERAVDACLAAHPRACVVAACGRNEPLRARLAGRGLTAARLVALGWTDRMPSLTRAADVVVTNAGGATALEALASERAVLLFEPIAGHGKANAALMEQAGLGRVCRDSAGLSAVLAELLGPSDALARMRGRITEHIGALDFESEVAAMPTLPRHLGARTMSGADALFVGASTPSVPQQVGAVAMLHGAVSDQAAGVDELVAALRARLAERGAELPVLRRQLWLRRCGRPRWVSVAPEDLDPAAHIRGRTVSAAEWDRALVEFFDEPVPDNDPPWRLLVLARPGAAAVLVTLHHALGDGLAVIAALAGLLSDRPVSNLRPVPPGDPGPAREPGRLLRLARGLFELAGAGKVITFSPPRTGDRRRYTLAGLPAAQVRATARALHTSTTALLLGVLGEALHRHGTPVPAPHRVLRTAVPLTARRVGDAPAAGNHTSVAMLDLPVGPMRVRERIERMASVLAAHHGSARSAAVQLVVEGLGRLPGPGYRVAARLVYGGRFFSAIGSVLPGWRREFRLFGSVLAPVYPVLPLAPGVGLAVGFLSWGDTVGMGITADLLRCPDPDGLAGVLLEVFNELAAETAAVTGEVSRDVR